MAVAAAGHLSDQLLVPCVQRGQLAVPPQHFRMPRVPALALGQDGPDGVELAVLTEQVRTAKPSRLDVPDPHRREYARPIRCQVFHFGWDRVDAKLIDQRFLRRGDYNVTVPGSYQVWEYLVEFTDTGGGMVRLPIQEKTFKLRLPDLGGTVPIRVNRRRTKAAFDLKDPRIDAIAALKRAEKAREDRDEARFEARLRGIDPPQREGSESDG